MLNAHPIFAVGIPFFRPSRIPDLNITLPVRLPHFASIILFKYLILPHLSCYNTSMSTVSLPHTNLIEYDMVTTNIIRDYYDYDLIIIITGTCIVASALSLSLGMAVSLSLPFS